MIDFLSRNQKELMMSAGKNGLILGIIIDVKAVGEGEDVVDLAMPLVEEEGKGPSGASSAHQSGKIFGVANWGGCNWVPKGDVKRKSNIVN